MPAEAQDPTRGSVAPKISHSGSRKVSKALMAPRIGSAEKTPQANVPAKPASDSHQPMSVMASAMRRHLQEVRTKVEENCDYVGDKFAEEARKIHYGETEHRSIYGEASPDEAKALHEEGIEFHPLPILPDDQN